MRNPIHVLKSLEEKASVSNNKYERLYRNLYNPEFYLLAYANIAKSQGSMTQGVDGQTLDNMSLPRINRIIESIRNRTYQPKPAKRKYIPKKNGKLRPLGITSTDDKLVQEVVRMILEAIYEPTFSNNSHGFRPKRSCHTALTQVKKNFTGVTWIVEGDIKACFDNFDHHVLVELLRKRISDEAFIGLIWKFLKAGYMEQWQYHMTYSGTPQGSGMSPILANIYLNELDRYMGEYKARFYKPTRTANPAHRNMASKIFYYKAKNDKVWDDLSVEEKKECARTLRQMRSEQRKLPTHPVQETSYKAIQYVRYADDFIVGVIGSHEDAKKLKQDLTVFLKEKLGLTLSTEKTKITNTAENARFLGYDISVSRSQDIKRLKNGKRQRVYSGVVQLRMPLEKWTAKLLEYGAIRIKKDESGKERWKTMPRGKLINRTDIEILSRYNSEIRGLYNYYAIAGNVSTLNHFSSRMKYSMLKTFGSKYRCKVRKIKERYVKNGEFTVAYKTKSGMKESVYYHDGFRKKTEPALGQVDMLDIYKKYDKPNSLAIRLHTNKCELCGTDCDGLEMHQVRRLKDLNGEQEWERIMLQRRRKTLAVCPSCHIEIHNSMKS